MLTLLVAVGGTIACARRGAGGADGVQDRSTSQLSRVNLDDSCIEAVARWMVHAPDEREGRTTVFFLELPNGGEPTFELLDRLSSASIRVKRRSACKFEGSYGEPVDCESGAEGTILSIGKSEQGSDGRIHVEIARHCGGLCGQGGTLTLEKRGASWVVLNYGMRWIS